MAKVICEVCGREIDSRGLSGHMRTHVSKEGDTDGVISYPSNESKTKKTNTVVVLDESPSGTTDSPPGGTRSKKPVKRTVASKLASKTASSPDTRGQRKTETEHKEEWQGLFR